MNTLIRYIVLIASFLLHHQHVFACSCIQSNEFSPESEIKSTDVIFKGVLVSKEKVLLSKGEYDFEDVWKLKCKFAVGVIYRGKKSVKLKQESIIFTDLGNSGDCGFSFKEGQEYIVYANYLKYGLETNICTRTTSNISQEEQHLLKYSKKKPYEVKKTKNSEHFFLDAAEVIGFLTLLKVIFCF